MAVTVTHPFVSAIADGADATVVRPSNWNATHSISGTLDVANGGTGVTSSTGTGSTVLSALPTFAGAIVSVTDNTNAALRITQLGTGNALLVEDSTNPDSSPFVVDGIGRLLVGTTTARSNFYNGANTAQMQLEGTSYQSAAFAVVCNANSDDKGSLILAKNRGTTVGSNTIVQDGDDLGSIDFQGSDGAEFVQAALIKAEVDGTPGTNDMPGRLIFSTTADGASSPTERMRISSSGNVGIGGTPTVGVNLDIRKTLTGTTSTYGVNVQATIQSDVTATSNLFSTYPSTAAAAFTLTSLRHFDADQGTIGVGSTVTNQYGFRANSTITGATNNYGFYGNIASGTNRYNLYMAGTAANYLAGTLTAIGGISGGTF